MHRVDMHRLQELVRLHRMGSGAREVARLLGMSPNTEREYREALSARGLLEGDPQMLPDLDLLRECVVAAKPPRTLPQQTSSIEVHAEKVRTMVELGAARMIVNDLQPRERIPQEGE